MAEKGNVQKNKQFPSKREIDYFFAINAGGQAQCLICGKILQAARTFNFARHYNVLHKNKYDKLSADDRRQLVTDLKLKWQVTSPSCQNSSPLEQSLTASYSVALQIARSNKSFTDGELIKTCAIDMARAFNNEAAVSSFQTVSLSRQVVASRIKFVDSQIQGNLKTLLSRCRYYSLRLVESTDVTDINQLLIFVRFIQDDFTVNEELLNLVSLHGSMQSQDIFNAVYQNILDFVGSFDKCSLIITDGAPAMIDDKLGFKSILREHSVKCSVLHCIIHQENLCGKVLKLSSTMKIVTKVVNMIRGGNKAFPHKKFQLFLESVNASYGDIPLHSEIRWLSAGKTLQSFFALRKHIPQFLVQNVKHSEQMQIVFKDLMFLKELAFLTDVTEHLNTLNLELQEKHCTVSELMSYIGIYRNQFDLFCIELSKNELRNFPSCEDLKQDLSDLDADYSTFASTLQSIVDEFDARSKDFDLFKADLAIFNNPLEISISDQAIIYRLELCDLQADVFLINRVESGLDFFKLLPEDKYPTLRDLGLRICSMFGSTYMCNSASSVMKQIKSRARASLTDSTLSHLMRISSSSIPVDIPALVEKTIQPQCSH